MRRIIGTMAVILSAVFWGSGAQANDIYMEQVGDGTTITLTQTGSSNSIGTSTIPAYIGGNSNTITVDQIGGGNTLDLMVNGSAIVATVYTVGSNNTQVITCGTLSSASCSSSTITQTVTGDNNFIKQDLGAGANHTSNILVTGDSNTVLHTSTGSGANSANITVTGGVALSGNNVSVTQSGTNAHQITLSTTGNSNNITVNQSN